MKTETIKNKMKKIILLLLISSISGCTAKSELASISGTITLSPQLSIKLEPSDLLEILAISEESMHSFMQEELKGKIRKNLVPIAIQKLAPVTFPLKYRISEEDILFPENRFKGNLFIIARIEKNGANRLGEKKTLEGFYQKNPVSVGSKNVDILIDQEKP